MFRARSFKARLFISQAGAVNKMTKKVKELPNYEPVAAANDRYHISFV